MIGANGFIQASIHLQARTAIPRQRLQYSVVNLALWCADEVIQRNRNRKTFVERSFAKIVEISVCQRGIGTDPPAIAEDALQFERAANIPAKVTPNARLRMEPVAHIPIG